MSVDCSGQFERFLSHPEHDREPRLDRVNDPGGHGVGGVAMASTDPAAALQRSVVAALVAHEFVDPGYKDPRIGERFASPDLPASIEQTIRLFFEKIPELYRDWAKAISSW